MNRNSLVNRNFANSIMQNEANQNIAIKFDIKILFINIDCNIDYYVKIK